MEVERNIPPKDGYLKEVRNLADENNIILIFDECTSGFRESYGGLHKKYNVDPDMAIFGKALGNGYSITSVIGKESIMQHAQDTFISSTFWTERIGPSAALETLKIMKRDQTWKVIIEIGKRIKGIWKELSLKYDIPIEIFGIDALPKFKFKSEDNLVYKTYITQEMLTKGFLATNAVYVSTAHKPRVINDYKLILDNIFKKIVEQKKSCLKADSLLRGKTCHSEFKRLN